MHKVDCYLLKNSCYFFILANLIAWFFASPLLTWGVNGAALLFSLLLLFMIRLTIHRYAGFFGRETAEIKDRLARYMEDQQRGKLSFFDYLYREIGPGPRT